MSRHQKNNSLLQQLTDHFHLENELFSDKSGFFFEGAQRQHNLETLRHLASFGDMVLFLTGEKGAGKTHTLQKLVSSSFEGLNVIYLDCERLIMEGQGRSNFILESCQKALGLKVEPVSTAELLNALLVECHRKLGSEGVRTLFAFDNADKLPRKELQAYCSFCRELPSESALVMLFSGSSALTQVFKVGSNLEQEVWWHQIQLKPLSQAEVLPYLEQALSQAGYSEKLELTENQIQQMADLGKGLPGRINKIFPSVVLEPGLLKIKAKSKVSGTPVWIMLGLAGLLIVSFLFVSYQHGLFERVMPVFSLDELSSVDDESAVSSKEIDERDSKQKARLAMLDGVLKEKGINLPKVEQKPVLEKKEHVSESILGELVVLGEELVAEPESEVAVAAVESGIDESLSINTPTTSEAPSNDRILTSTQVNGNPDVYGNKTLGVSQEISEPKLNNDLDLKKKDEVKQIPVEKVANESIHFRSKAWLQGYSNNSYMAQILGSYSEETALNFIDQVGKQKFEVFYLVNEHKGKPWYVVFYGIFPAKTHAQDAVKNAPKIIRSQNPWIRRSSEVLASYPK